MLDAFGLDHTTESLYRCILDRPRTSVGELAPVLEISLEALAECVERLLEVGLIKPGDEPEVYTAAPPDQSLEILIAREQAALDARRAALCQLQEAIPEFVSSYLGGSRTGEGDLERFDQSESVRSRLYQLAREATTVVRSMIPGPAFSPAATQASERLDRSVLERGVQVQAISSAQAITTPYWRDYLLRIDQQGAQIRIHHAPPLLFVLFDDEVSVVPTEKGGAYVVNGREPSAPTTVLFEQVWSQSQPLREAVADPADQASLAGLEPRARHVLTLLGQGLTDEVIARRMGVSDRTVRRLVSVLCDSLQAQSRFQAGVFAAERGWL